MAYEELLFKRGYLLTDTHFSGRGGNRYDHILGKWNREPVGGFLLCHDPASACHRAGGGGAELVLLGTAIDPVNGLPGPGPVVERLHSMYLLSEDSFFDGLDHVTGRFVLFVVTGNRSFVLQDADGTRTLFYDSSDGGFMISSHSSLIAMLKGRMMSRAAGDFIGTAEYVAGRRHFPGVTTPYEGIRMLTPNTLLRLPELQVERFFPREPLLESPVTDELVSELAGLFAAQVDLLAGNHRLAVSLTGGTDSRLTLASTAAVKSDVMCFTYVEDDANRADAELAAGLCRRTGITHYIYRVDPETCGSDLEEYMEMWRLATASMRADSQGRISKVLYDRYPADCLHLKSNVSEMGRVSFRRSRTTFMPGIVDPFTLARLYGINPRNPFVRGSFRDFIDVADFRQDRFFNYDIYDLFHWEHRLGAWQSLQIMDFDTSHDTFILFNNRHILKKMLGVHRLRNTLHLRLMEHLWPEVLETPFLNDLRPRAINISKTVVKDAKYRSEKTLAVLPRKPLSVLAKRHACRPG